MQTLRVFLLALSFCVASFAFAAGSDNLQTMAKIMSKLNHYPSDEEKATLKKIAGGGADFEKVLAGSMINLEHKVADADKPKLQNLVKDSKASAQEKDMASIILNFNHKPTDEDQKKLSAMLQ